MAGTKGKSGGKRQGAGAPRRNQTWGPIDERRGLHNFFRSPNRASVSSSSVNSNSTSATPLPREHTPIAPRNPVVNNHTPSTSATPPAQRTRPPQGRQNETSNTRTQQNTTRAAASSTGAPNMDVDELFDENLIRTGKRVGKSENLNYQKKKIMENSYYRKAQNDVRNGNLWDNPPSFVTKPEHNLKQRWMDFFKLRIFNWMPDIMLGESWRPKCPNCGHCMIKYGHSNPPRIVFDQHENYWLNAPTNFQCTECKRQNAPLPKGHPAKKQYNWNSASEAVLSQVKAESPEVFDAMPCHLSYRNAIDKKLMNTIIHNAVKGIGPSAMAASLISWHELQWQKRENQWGANVSKELQNPTITGMLNPIRREEIEKCPHYFSEKLGGCVPSGSWLTDMFCLVLEEMRPYFDSEVGKRLKSSLILAIDASYKICKLMMKWGHTRIYDALHSGTNEYNEIIMQCFSTSDNHKELGANLEALRRLGLNPFLCFTDNPERDESLLLSIFPNLKGDYEQEEVVDPSLTPMTTEKEVMYLHSKDNVLAALSSFIQDLEGAINNPAGPKVKVSFDTEWPIFMERNEHRRRRTHGNINILTLASNVTQYTLIIELYNFKNNRTHLQSIGQKLCALFSLKVSCFTGCKHMADYTKLSKQYPMFNLPQTREVLSLMDDVSLMAINRGVTTRGKDKTTLQALCRGQKMDLKKPKHVRVGDAFNSTGGSLAQEAITYCQLDVEAPLKLHSIYEGLPDLTKRLTKKPVHTGMIVDIMPESAKAIHPIAQGFVQMVGDGRSTKWGSHTVKKGQVLVTITQVFNGKGVIHYPRDGTHLKKCSCGRSAHGSIQSSCDYYMFSQLGRPPYTLLELKSRLREKDEAIEYPECIFSSAQSVTQPQTTVNFTQVRNEQETIRTESGDNADDVAAVEGDADDDDYSIAVEDELLQTIPDELFEDMNDGPSVEAGVDDEELSPEEVRRATSEDFTVTLEKLIADADALAAEHMNKETTEEQDDTLPVDELPEGDFFKRVLSDMFHNMDRAKTPMHHEYKALFFRSLRAASFLMLEEDVQQVKEVLNSKPGESWEKKMAFDYDYIAKRVRRRVPPPMMLYHRLKAVFDFFKDKKDSQTGHTLFTKTNMNKFNNMLEMIKKGFASDPTHFSMYVPKTDNHGRVMVDNDGLPLYRSIRGTSNLESLHQYLMTSFGHTMAGPRYTDVLMMVLRHFYNWRSSRRNRPGFPPLNHYDGRLIDRINNLYEIIYGYPKYREWESFNEHLPLEKAFGVVEIDPELTSNIKFTDEDKSLVDISKSLKYLANRQNSPIPFLPIRGEKEKRLAHRKLREIMTNNESVSSQAVFDRLSKEWNSKEISVANKIFPKLPSHFARYIKSWRKNQDRRAAALSSGVDCLNDVLETPLQVRNIPTFEPAPLQNPTDQNSSTDNLTANNQDPTVTPIVETGHDALAVMATAAATQPPIQEVATTEPSTKRRKTHSKRTCQGIPEEKRKCPIPLTCKGRNGRANCILKTNGDSSKEVKRTITNWTTPKCFTCRKEDCLGISQRDRCPDWGVCINI